MSHGFAPVCIQPVTYRVTLDVTTSDELELWNWKQLLEIVRGESITVIDIEEVEEI